MIVKRKYPLLSACGLNCGLCPYFHTIGNSKCDGCGGENFNEKHCSCSIINCNQRKGIEFCYFCEEYPCKKYGKWEKDSFITHQNMMKNFEKVKNTGLNIYKKELNEKIKLLNYLLTNYNDGRRKSFFCLAVNLLELDDVKNAIKKLKKDTVSGNLDIKEKAIIAVKLFEATAKEKNIILKLNKQPHLAG